MINLKGYFFTSVLKEGKTSALPSRRHYHVQALFHFMWIVFASHGAERQYKLHLVITLRILPTSLSSKNFWKDCLWGVTEASGGVKIAIKDF